MLRPLAMRAEIENPNKRLNRLADAVAVLDALRIAKAHIVGLSMGGFATVHFGLTYPERALSLTVAGAGYGCEKEHEEYFRGVSLEVARRFAEDGAAAFAPTYAEGASRVQFQEKDPRGWREFADRLATHDDAGASLTMRGVQRAAPPSGTWRPGCAPCRCSPW